MTDVLPTWSQVRILSEQPPSLAFRITLSVASDKYRKFNRLWVGRGEPRSLYICLSGGTFGALTALFLPSPIS